jgi:cation transport ATPase
MENSYRVTIEGMHCGSCEKKIHDALIPLPSVAGVRVSSTTGSAEIRAADELDEEAIRDAISNAGDYRVTGISQGESALDASSSAAEQHSVADDPTPESLYPLFLIVGFILGVTLLVAWSTGDWAVEPMMRHFMAGFFIVFSFFKLLDPPGFVSAYRGYDLLARKSATWAWMYPYIELALGVMYLMAWIPVWTNIITLILMLIGAIGVLKALLDKRAIRCACLGTALNLPMTKVTLVEDLTMASMAGGMLILLTI